MAMIAGVRIDRTCVDCGGAFRGSRVAPRCEPCRTAHYKAYQRAYQKENPTTAESRARSKAKHPYISHDVGREDVLPWSKPKGAEWIALAPNRILTPAVAFQNVPVEKAEQWFREWCK